MKKIVIVVLGIWLSLAASLQAQEKKAEAKSSSPSAQAQEPGTETVVTTFRVRPGKEKEFLDATQQNWPALLRLGLVLPQPHVLLRGADDAGKPVFIEILTWVDHDVADHVPAEIKKVWAQLESLCESRDGHPGIDYPEFQIVSQAP